MKSVLRDYPVVLITGYFLLAFAVKISSGVDIMPPCLWLTLAGARCPGCGLTTAGESIFRLDFTGAWQASPMIYIVAPALVLLFIRGIIVMKYR